MRLSRKAINFLLMTIAFSIWMVFFYRIIFQENQNQSDVPAVIQEAMVAPVVSKKAAQYNNGQKDPFITPFNQYKPKPQQELKKPVEKKEPVPVLRLLGTIDNKMAIIAFPDNSVKYLKVKQVANAITVVKISKDKVEFKFKNKVYRIEN
jgi:hypothetical protein